MDLATQVRSALLSQGLPATQLAWIQSVLPNRNPMPPLPALVATAKARMMASDICSGHILEPDAASLPPNITNQAIQEIILPRDVLLQVLDIENLSKSKWEQVEELEAIARGERTRGREVIRLPSGGNNNDDDSGEGDEVGYGTAATQAIPPPNAARAGSGAGSGTATPKNTTHRLVLQDCRGQKVYGLELKRIDKIALGKLSMGEKILLRRGAVVARGVVLLEPTKATVMGGKVEAWQKAWLDGRLARLRDAIDSGA